MNGGLQVLDGGFTRRRRVAASAYLLRDTFTDADGTNLTAHTMDVGSGWTVHLGSLEIVTGDRAGNPAGAEARATAESADADVAVSVIVRFDSTVNGALIVRYVDASNYWGIYLTPGIGIRIFEVVAGSFTLRASSAPAITTGVDYLLAATASATTISATVDGGSMASYGSASAHQSATRHGMYLGAQQVVMDDFEVIAA